MRYLLLVFNFSEILSFCNRKTFKTCRNVVNILKCQKRKMMKISAWRQGQYSAIGGEVALSGDKSKWVSQLKMNNGIFTMYIGHSCQMSLLFPVGFWPDFYNFDHIFKIWTTFDIIDNMYHNLHSISQLFPDFSEMRVEIWQKGRQTGQERQERLE